MPIFGKKKPDPERFMREGLKHLKGGMYVKAREEFRRGLEISPQYNELHYLLGLTHLREGNEKEAEHEFKKTLQDNPHHLEAKRELDLILSKKAGQWVATVRKRERFTGIEKSIHSFPGEKWEEVKSMYADYFSDVKKKEGEASFKTHMRWQEFAFLLSRREEDAPSFFFFTEKHRLELAGEIFELLLRYASSLPPESKKIKEVLLEQAQWIARNIGDESHIARLERVSWR